MSYTFGVAILLSTGWYSWLIIRRLFAWNRMQPPQMNPTYLPSAKLSVIIPVRNEADNILPLLQDLEQQTYPKELFEVLVVDDHSEDGTAGLAAQFILSSDLQLNLIELDNYVKSTGKKAAVQKGVELAQGELLVFTDGDCRVQPQWLALFAYTYTSQQPYFISGPVSFYDTHTWFGRMQLVEFASLVGIGGASIALGKPNMCNGANLAYTPAAFGAVGGFAGNEAIASGDDEFLLHKLSQVYPDKIAFLKNPEAIVYTESRKTLTSFLSQRVRWASKWKSYQRLDVQLVALAVFLANLLLLAAIPAAWLGWLPVSFFLAAYVAKFAVDLLFLKYVLHFLGKPGYLWYVLPLQLVYIPYVVLTALGGLWGRYSWKGRIIRNK